MDQINLEEVENEPEGMSVGQPLAVLAADVAAGKQQGSALALAIDDQGAAVPTLAERDIACPFDFDLAVEPPLAQGRVSDDHVVHLKRRYAPACLAGAAADLGHHLAPARRPNPNAR